MQYNGLSYRPYLDFPSFFHYYLFSGPGSNPGSHFVFSFHASLVSCNLRPFLGLCLLCLVGFIEYWPAICKTPQCFQEANQNWRTSLGLEKLHKEGLCVASDRKPTLNHPVTHGIYWLKKLKGQGHMWLQNGICIHFCLLAWFFSEQSDHSQTCTYHIVIRQQGIWLYPSSVCVILTSVPPSQLCSYWLWFCHLPILEPGGKYKWFSASEVRICCPELWPPSCDYDRWGRHKNLKNGQELEFWTMSFGCRIKQPWMWPGYMK